MDTDRGKLGPGSLAVATLLLQVVRRHWPGASIHRRDGKLTVHLELLPGELPNFVVVMATNFNPILTNLYRDLHLLQGWRTENIRSEGGEMGRGPGASR